MTEATGALVVEMTPPSSWKCSRTFGVAGPEAVPARQPVRRLSRAAAQRELRDRMLAAGAGISEIADELALSFSLRPRPAWRYAHGWSLVQAAEQINATAYAAGMHASGVLAAMTAPHLSEHETWPGGGPVVTGRRPTPQVLALLARTYGADIPDLLDALDHERLPPGDQLIIEVFRGDRR